MNNEQTNLFLKNVAQVIIKSENFARLRNLHNIGKCKHTRGKNWNHRCCNKVFTLSNNELNYVDEMYELMAWSFRDNIRPI